MLNKNSDNSYSFSVSSRESFIYNLDFENQVIVITYICKTDNYRYTTTYAFLDFLKDCFRVDPSDYGEVAQLVDKSIYHYISTNIISGSVRRAWSKFKDELCGLYNSLDLSKNYQIL